MRLHLGCGKRLFDGWVNVDGVDNGQEVVAELSSLPFGDGAASEILSVHVIEHIPPRQVVSVLKEWRRVLRSDGLLAIECPNLRVCMQTILDGDLERLKACYMGIYSDPAHTDLMQVHRWGWMPETLTEVCYQAGFLHVEHCAAHWKHPWRDMRIEARK